MYSVIDKKSDGLVLLVGKTDDGQRFIRVTGSIESHTEFTVSIIELIAVYIHIGLGIANTDLRRTQCGHSLQASLPDALPYMLLILQLPRRDLGFDLLKMPKIRIVLQTAMKTKCRHIVSMRSKMKIFSLATPVASEIIFVISERPGTAM